MQDDFLRSLFRCELGGIDHHFSIRRLLVGVRNAGEFLDNSSPRLRVETFAIALFAYVNRRGEMHQNKSANWLDHGAHMRSEEHTSELQSRLHLVCRLLLEKKKQQDRDRVDPLPCPARHRITIQPVLTSPLPAYYPPEH